MSALIIKPFDVYYFPADMAELSKSWHNLHTLANGKIQRDGGNVTDALCPIIQAGVKPDWDSPLCDVPSEMAAEIGESPLKDFKILMADLRSRGLGVLPLHVPGGTYSVHQNKLCFDLHIASADKVLGPNGYEIAVVGTLGAYSQFVVSLAIKGKDLDFDGDKWLLYYTLNTSHNSLISSSRFLSTNRPQCWNQLNIAINEADANGRRTVDKHTKNSLEGMTIDRFAADFQSWLNERDSLETTLKALRAYPMTKDQFRSFASGLFTNDKSLELSTTSFNRVEAMVPRFEGGRGNVGMGNHGKTAYDAINAVTEEFTHGESLGRTTGKDPVTQEKRFANANYGRGNDWKQEALRVLRSEDSLLATMKRGEILYCDKVKAMATSN
jgi:hypothetical protein